MLKPIRLNKKLETHQHNFYHRWQSKEVIMAVKVIINRRFKEGKEKEFFALLKKFRSEAMDQEGYITGETLVGFDDPQNVLVIATWQNRDNWLKWKEDSDRKENEALLQQCLERPTEYEVYVLGPYPQKKK
jgi:heme-degrading monooxygenase HmoA